MPLRDIGKRIHTPFSRISAVYALDERIAVHAFRDGRVSLVCANVDAVQTAIVLCHQIIAALRYSTLDAGVLACFVHVLALFSVVLSEYGHR